ncbi:MAG: VOC family protein [Terracidiphilus sp.]
MAKVVGFGGVFLKARDPKALAAWYATNLGVPALGGGSMGFDGPESTGMTVFCHFPLDTAYFGDGPQSSMVNFRVDDEDFDYGRFAWIWDPEGNRVELWQP